MPSNRRRRSFTALVLLSATAAPSYGQAPPPEVKRHVLADVGPLPAPAACGCVTAPFRFTPARPGWGYGSGPAAPDTDAAPSRGERVRQRQADAETLASLRTDYDDALLGNDAASFSIALDLTTGTALERNETAVANWLLLAASQGHRDAYVQLGHRYRRGLGVEQNDRTAAYWFHEAAVRGDTIAMTALGGLYAAGRGVPQDWAAAVWWWRKAGAWQFVGDAYACGVGVEQDNERAAVHTRRAPRRTT